MKKMSLDIVSDKKVNLLIERDSGNEELILMGSNKAPNGRKNCTESWKRLRDLCNEAIIELSG